MIRVFVADDHAIVREGLGRLLADRPDMKLVGEAPDGHQVLRRAETEEWDVLVLDLSLKTLDGIEVLRRLRELRPQVAVIVFSMYPEDQYALRLLKMGASAYVSKGRPTTELLDVIRQVAAGNRLLPTSSAPELPPGTPEEAAPHHKLTERELQVFMSLAVGRASGDVAAELNLSPSTVSGHVAKIREKLGVRSIGEIVQYAHRAGLVR